VKFVDQPRSPVRASKPAEPEIDSAEVLKRVATIQRESLDRFDDDIAFLTKDLQRQGVPKAALCCIAHKWRRSFGQSCSDPVLWEEQIRPTASRPSVRDGYFANPTGPCMRLYSPLRTTHETPS
jgi:hypothetical protein